MSKCHWMCIVKVSIFGGQFNKTILSLQKLEENQDNGCHNGVCSCSGNLWKYFTMQCVCRVFDESRVKISPDFEFWILYLKSLYDCPLSSHHWANWSHWLSETIIKIVSMESVEQVKASVSQFKSQVNGSEWGVMAFTCYSVCVQLEDQLSQRSYVPLHRDLCTKLRRVVLSEETKHSVCLSLFLYIWVCVFFVQFSIQPQYSWFGVCPKAILQEVSPLLSCPLLSLSTIFFLLASA